MWVPDPVDTSGVELPVEVQQIVEILAANAHSVWGRERIQQGWRHAAVRDDRARTHSMLQAYREVPDEEREMDRILVTETLKAMMTMGFRFCPPPVDSSQPGAPVDPAPSPRSAT